MVAIVQPPRLLASQLECAAADGRGDMASLDQIRSGEAPVAAKHHSAGHKGVAGDAVQAICGAR
jgi:hypothetical protein